MGIAERWEEKERGGEEERGREAELDPFRLPRAQLTLNHQHRIQISHRVLLKMTSIATKRLAKELFTIKDKGTPAGESVLALSPPPPSLLLRADFSSVAFNFLRNHSPSC